MTSKTIQLLQDKRYHHDVMEDNPPPLCDVCRHRHHQGTKCGICGHVGRCNIFPKMHQKSVKAAQLHFQYITAKTLHDRTSGFYDLIKELRSQIFCYNGSIWTLGTEFSDEEHDEQCSNLVAFLGDAPVCTARLFIVEKAMNIPTVIIDRFGVVQRYRGMGLGRLSLYDIPDHVSKVL